MHVIRQWICWQLYRSQPSSFYLYQEVTAHVAMGTVSVQQGRSSSLLCRVASLSAPHMCSPRKKRGPLWVCCCGAGRASGTVLGHRPSVLTPFIWHLSLVWNTLQNMNNAIFLVVIAHRESWGEYFVRISSSVCRQQYMQVLHFLLQKMSSVNAQKYVNCLFLETSLESFAYSVISQRTSSVYSCLELRR